MSEQRRTLYISETPFGANLPGVAEENPLYMEVRANVAGAITELREGREVIIFGYPCDSRSPWFQVLSVPKKGHHALSLALERIVYARSIGNIVALSEKLVRVAEHSVAVYHGMVAVKRHSDR